MNTARIGIFGGTFDPPHLGHLILAAEAHAQLELTRLLWVLTAQPPHKPDRPISTLEHRVAMVELTLTSNPDFELSRLEIERPGPHYAVDTVRMLKEQSPNAEIVYLMGGDSLRDLPTWRQPRELVAATDLIGVMRRPGAEFDLSELEIDLPGIKTKIRFVDAPLLDISSQAIRLRAAQGGHFRYYLPDSVYNYILKHSLYKRNDIPTSQK